MIVKRHQVTPFCGIAIETQFMIPKTARHFQSPPLSVFHLILSFALLLALPNKALTRAWHIHNEPDCVLMPDRGRTYRDQDKRGKAARRAASPLSD